jgi:sugar transferase (PEP-CTERM/EpsH1 system associated)
MAKVLFLTPRFPHPLDKGDKLRAFHQIKVLADHHDVVLCALSHDPVSPASVKALDPYCTRIEVIPLSRFRSWLHTAAAGLRNEPLQVGYFWSRAAGKRVRRLIGELAPDHVVAQLIRTARYVRDLPVTKTIDYMDAFSRGLRQREEMSSVPVRLMLGRERRAVRNYERAVFDEFDHHTIISERDRHVIDHDQRDSIRLVPNGVDLEAFAPRSEPAKADLLFVGNMSYSPNVTAATILAREILPLVQETRPGCRLLVAGTAPTRAVLRLRSASVTVTGWIDDIAGCYARSRVFVAPMMAATGIQNKLLQAMASGLPCVTTSLANQALGAGPDEVLLAQTPREFADAVEHLLSDPEAARELGRKGRELVLRSFQWRHATHPLLEIIESSDHRGAPAHGTGSDRERRENP